MKENNKDIDFLHEIAKKISERSKHGFPISPEEVFDLFGETLESMNDKRIIETPIFVPFIIEKTEEEFYTARCNSFRLCKGMGVTEEEAIENLKEQIDSYHKSSIETEKRMRMEEIIKNLFRKDHF
ncbi:type II toxin-antitoxin system HicB family antitoxin [Heyndrickxia ginsengihumi]|uniref:Uncharacterized protein n=1 Tax=Heyndrickxia ginsengihumi TaxID=363870 RepID=A0A0A6V972_9BACI|nr:hypothetical protein [Heyndrickxia ginsengihumi]KHD84123.1 hypothetical protein NG54_17555 [Heyndrickxia ginsengihumi]